jgi:phosphoserine phosphatase RsbX
VKLLVSKRTRPMIGEIDNGDTVIAHDFAHGQVLCVVDALGHGPAAAIVARCAEVALSLPNRCLDASRAIENLDLALRGTRGAAALVTVFDGTRLTACGVGNVEMKSTSRSLQTRLFPGVLGTLARRVHADVLEPRVGDRFALYSDGISGRFSLADTSALSLDQATRMIFSEHARPHDDATLALAEVIA